MAKKKQSMSKNTRKSQARVSRGASNKPKKNRATQQVQRTLLSGSVPRSYMGIASHGQERIVIKGQEVVQQVDCTVNLNKLSFVVNPTVNELFPRLSTLALAFERFRFRSLQLRFYTAAPATRSGSIGLRINTNPLAVAPNDFITLAASEYSVVGSISECLSTPNWVNRDPEDFYLRPVSVTGSVTVNANALKTFQASLDVLTTHASDADDGSIGGYLAIVYEIELITPVACVQRTFNLTDLEPRLMTKASEAADCRFIAPIVNPSHPRVSGDPVGQSVGAFPAEPIYTGLGRAAVDFWSNADDKQSNAVSELLPGRYSVFFGQDLEAESDFLKKVELKDYNYVHVNQSTPRPAALRLRLGIEPAITAYYNPAFVKEPASWEQPLPPGFHSDVKTADDLSAKLLALHGSLAPLAAGDWAQAIYAYLPSKKTWEVVYSAISAIGTAAYNGASIQTLLLVEEAIGFVLASYPANNGKSRVLKQTRYSLSARDV